MAIAISAVQHRQGTVLTEVATPALKLDGLRDPAALAITC